MVADDAQEQPGEIRRRVLTVLLWFSLGGSAAIVVYAIRTWDLGPLATIIAVGLMVAAASMAIGGTLGFIFAIPRVRGTSTASSPSEESNERPSRSLFDPNANLEQISDWLTKIIIGVGLIELREIATRLSQVASTVAHGFGDAPSDYPFVLALIVYFLVCGFLIAYLWTRLYLPEAFVTAEQSARKALGAARAALEGTRFPEVAIEPDDAEARLRAHVLEYETIRDSMAAGSLRTMEMTKVVTSIRALARALRYEAEQVKDLFAEGTEGARVAALALTRELRLPDTLSVVIEAIVRSRSAFEQYQALHAVDAIFSLLSPDRKDAVVTAIRDQRSGGPGKYITRSTDRWGMSDKILAKASATSG